MPGPYGAQHWSRALPRQEVQVDYARVIKKGLRKVASEVARRVRGGSGDNSGS